jgi:hypothetical protein
MANFYPPGSFYFAVSFSGISAKIDAAFQEASGINADIETEEAVVVERIASSINCPRL